MRSHHSGCSLWSESQERPGAVSRSGPPLTRQCDCSMKRKSVLSNNFTDQFFCNILLHSLAPKHLHGSVLTLIKAIKHATKKILNEKYEDVNTTLSFFKLRKVSRMSSHFNSTTNLALKVISTSSMRQKEIRVKPNLKEEI